MASKGVNKVILLGNLGKDPEVRYLTSGDAVCNLTVATSESWKDKQGQPQEKTEWHKCSAFGKLAEIMGEYLKKGSKVFLEGSIHTRKWQGQDGEDKYTTEIKVRDMQMLGSSGGAGSAGGSGAQAAANGGESASQKPASNSNQDDFDDSDVPF